jgi:predicted DNA-binding protein
MYTFVFMSKKRSKEGAVTTVPLRVPEDMQSKIRGLATKSRLSDADIMRLAIERGIGQVEKMFEPAETQAA